MVTGPGADLLPLADAQARLLALRGPLPTEECPLEEAAGRWLAADLAARVTQPPLDVSAMDGWAVRFAECPGPWTIAGESAAGGGLPGPLAAGTTCRIFTGAPVPPGADCIAVQEEMAAEGSIIRLTGDGPAGPGANIRRAGQDFRAGETLLEAGAWLGPARIGLAAAAGQGAVPVRRRARVALVATGDELVPPGAVPGPGQILSSNGVMLAALVAGVGAVPLDLGIVPDSAEATRAALVRAAGLADLVVTIGGASVGDHDHVRGAVLAAGGALDFWRIAIRPGKPLMAGRLGDALLVGLPGNPVSAFVCAHLLLLPLVRHLMGAARPFPEPEMAIAGSPLAANGARQDFLRATLEPGAAAIARPFARQDSSLLSVLAMADCLIVRPAFAPPLEAGSPVPVLRL
jgi:molybdopterin molybdotransferase